MMEIYIIKRSYFTFQGVESAELEVLGKTVAELMQSALSGEILAEDCDGNGLLQEGVFLESCYPFITQKALKKFCDLHGGSFAFEGGYVIKRGETRSQLPIVNVGGVFGQPVFSLRDFISATRLARSIQAEKYISEGVWVEEGASIDFGVQIEKGAYIGSHAVLKGACVIGENAVIGAGCYLFDTVVGSRTEITSSTLTESVVGDDCTVGPYAYLRPFSEVGNGCRIGDFVEIKRSDIGEGCKIAHLAYVGDATLGKGVNVGCGVVFVNYNGRRKLRSAVGDGAFLGSNCNVVAPVSIGKGAFVAAGTTVTVDIADGDFCVGRSRQTVKRNGASKYL